MVDKVVLIPILVVLILGLYYSKNTYHTSQLYDVVYYHKDTDTYSQFYNPSSSVIAVYYPINYTGIYHLTHYKNFVVANMVHNSTSNFDLLESAIRENCAPFYDHSKSTDYVINHKNLIISQIRFPCNNESFLKQLNKMNDPNYKRLTSFINLNHNFTIF